MAEDHEDDGEADGGLGRGDGAPGRRHRALVRQKFLVDVVQDGPFQPVLLATGKARPEEGALDALAAAAAASASFD